MQSAKISSYRVNTKEQNIKTLVNTHSCRKPVLSEAHFRSCFVEEAVGNIVFLILHTVCFFVFLKKGTNKKKFKITVMNSKVLSLRQHVHTINFNFHDTASLEFDLSQNGCEVRRMNIII
jgi:hypothetical protein